MGRSDFMRVPLPAARMMAHGSMPMLPLYTHARERTQKLADLDSNQDKQNQNLLCYRYTIGQGWRRQGPTPMASTSMMLGGC